MFRKLPYSILLFVLLILQLFIFDKLMISMLVAPVVYITFILLLPMDRSQLSMLMWGAAVGLLFDLLTGMAGVNSIATILLSYLRIWLLTATLGRDMIQLGIAPLPRAVGWGKFLLYMSLGVLFHLTTLFVVESLRFDQLDFLLRRVICSGLISTLFAVLIAVQFENLLARRR
ncbi:MAG: rod shape-determining protein MreD [Rikenellaceae bacterium]